MESKAARSIVMGLSVEWHRRCHDLHGVCHLLSGSEREVIDLPLAVHQVHLDDAPPRRLHPARGEDSAMSRLTRRVDRKSTRLNSSHANISYAVFCLIRPPPGSTLFPYTTLFRSIRGMAPSVPRPAWRVPSLVGIRT